MVPRRRNVLLENVNVCVEMFTRLCPCQRATQRFFAKKKDCLFVQLSNNLNMKTPMREINELDLNSHKGGKEPVFCVSVAITQTEQVNFLSCHCSVKLQCLCFCKADQLLDVPCNFLTFSSSAH